MNNTDTLESLAAQWLSAKAEEAAANKRRVAIEEQIVALTGKKDEGSKTVFASGFKLTITGKTSRKMDWEKWESIKAGIDPSMHPVKLKPELDEKGVKWLQENRADIYAKLPITVTPAKTAIEVKAVEK